MGYDGFYYSLLAHSSRVMPCFYCILSITCIMFSFIIMRRKSGFRFSESFRSNAVPVSYHNAPELLFCFASAVIQHT